ncbi:hypothetical protein ACFWHT_13575 [Microbacterium sp. NPDC058342]|uniref:hypothetical protein n=1 Tax=Microbacterium sp. NPDC058342 TaxID=3346454 RepID=UPI003660D9FA
MPRTRSGLYVAGAECIVILIVHREGGQPMESRSRYADWPDAVVDGERGPRGLEKAFDILPPSNGTDNVQSVCRYGASWLVFHHGSVMQEYSDTGDLVREVIVEGDLLHPNDCAVGVDEVIVCDAGEDVPVLKRVDPVAARVKERLPIEIPGWRLASVAVDEDGGILTVAAEDIPLGDRRRVLVNRYDAAGRELIQSFTVPSVHTYSQGCTVAGSFLYLNANDGVAAEEARITVVDLRSTKRVDTLHVRRFGETEGLDALWIGREPYLVTALRRAAYLVSAR